MTKILKTYNLGKNKLFKIALKTDSRPKFTLSKPISIDSLRMLIPEKYFNMDKLITITKNSTYTATGETESEQLTERKNMYQVLSPCKTISVYYKLTERQKDNKRYKFIEVAFSSKILKSQYHVGITAQNITTIYDHIINQNYIQNLTLQSFLDIELEDIDIKFDIKESLEDYKLFINHLPNNIKNVLNQKKYWAYKKANNYGLQINKRSLSTKNNKQLLKFYFKSLEMNYSKNNFFETYYDIEGIDNISRVETTIPNQAQFKKYFNKPLTFNTLLNLSEKQYQSIFTKIFGYLFIQNETEIIMKDEKLEQTVQAKFIRRALNLPTKDNRLESINHNYTNLIEDYKNWFPSKEHKDKKYRIKKITKLVYESMINDAKNYIRLKKETKKSLEKSYKNHFRNFQIKP
jgi:hypothetical protein